MGGQAQSQEFSMVSPEFPAGVLQRGRRRMLAQWQDVAKGNPQPPVEQGEASASFVTRGPPERGRSAWVP